MTIDKTALLPEGLEAARAIFDDRSQPSFRSLEAAIAAYLTVQNARPAAGEPVNGSDAAAIEIADAVLDWMVKHDLLDADQEYRDDDVIAVLDDLSPPSAQGETIPKLENCGRYLAEDNTGQWHYINHAGTWQACPSPVNRPQQGEPVAVKGLAEELKTAADWVKANADYHFQQDQKRYPHAMSLRAVETIRKAADILAGADLHPDDVAVDRFAAAMKFKLAKKRAEGRGGWENKGECTAEFLSELLRGHVEKGDPVDVGNLSMMLHQRGESIRSALSPAPSLAVSALAPEELQLLIRLRENRRINIHDVIESDPANWGLGFALSGRGYLAMVSHPKGATFHLTRLGNEALTAAIGARHE